MFNQHIDIKFALDLLDDKTDLSLQSDSEDVLPILPANSRDVMFPGNTKCYLIN